MSSSFSSGSLVSGRYRIQREIGRGGMATVYVARDETHGRNVAVKVLSRDLAGGVGAHRFLTEIRTTARLGHPNILPLIDSGEIDGAPYYVIPFVPGESLGDRLRREAPLPIEEALRLGTELAEALAHAHAHGVVHRDVKPSNVLLDESGNPYLADFGIARALSEGDTLQTSSGYVLGTPHYMSPEQISDDEEVGGTSDVYALACVLFEMLSGRPPFAASSSQAVLAAHLAKPPPSVKDVRPEVPEAVDKLLRKALAKRSAERIGTASEFARRLDEARAGLKMMQLRESGRAYEAFDGEEDADAAERTARHRRLAYAAAFVVLAGGVGAAAISRVAPEIFSSPPPDPARYAVMPFAGDAGRDGPGIAEELREALVQWEGIEVVDPTRMGGSTESLNGSLAWAEAHDIAVEADAGRIVTGEVRPTETDDSVRVEAVARETTRSGSAVQRVEFTVPTDGPLQDSTMGAVAETLLFGQASAGLGITEGGTYSVEARRQYGMGRDALQNWNLLEAERRFSAAIESDPFFELALVWRAQTRNWQGRPTPEWGIDARRVTSAGDELPHREHLLATALTAMADRRHPEACDAYEELGSSNPDDFAAWFGLGECRRRDNAVMPDPSSPSGWSFRGSGHAATMAYRRAFTTLPATYRAFGAGSFELLQALLYTQPAVRQGRGPPPDRRLFLGFREWRADTLAIVPVPADSLSSYDFDPEARSEAITRQQRALLDVTNSWVRAFPRSSDALHAQAVARDLVGDPAALATYRRARTLAEDPGLARRIGVGEVLLQIRLSLPDELEALSEAVALGDSLLSDIGRVDGSTAERLTELAVVLGRPNLATTLIRQSPEEGGLGNLSPDVLRETRTLVVFSAVGGPADSIEVLERRTARRIDETVQAGERRLARQTLLEQSAFLAFPIDTLEYLDDPEAPGSSEARAIGMLARGDADAASEALGDPPQGAGWDILLARANILVSLGRGARALELLRSRFDALGTADPATVVGPARLGALVRSAALRAELELEHGSEEVAVRWARAVSTIWSSGERGAEPVRSRMEEILRSRATP